MKRNAIVRIVIYTIILIILLCTLSVALNIGNYGFQFGSDNRDNTPGAGSVSSKNITKLKIEWASGNVMIYPEDVDTIKFSEKSSSSVAPQMVYHLDGDTLVIRYQKSAIRFGLFYSTPEKDLTVIIPNDWTCTEVNIETASSDLSVTGLSASRFDLECASGNAKFKNCQIGELDVDTASGDITYSDGKLDALDCDAASADFTGTFDHVSSVPKWIEFDGASGDFNLTIPSNSGFTVEVDSLSGNFSSNFSTEKIGNIYQAGQGQCRIKVSGASCDVTVNHP